MELRHSFTVPGTPADTWAAFSDIAGVAGCFPGAAVTSVEGDEFEGTCKVKLGPVALLYAGTGRFVERDEAAGRFVVEAKGKDKRGNGTAGATVTATISAAGSGSTVDVLTELTITGKPAQLGRGLMQDVSDKLLSQFVECLQSKVPAASEDPSAGSNEFAPRSFAPQTEPEVDDAIDVGAALLPVLFQSYWKQLAGVLVALVVIWRVFRR